MLFQHSNISLTSGVKLGVGLPVFDQRPLDNVPNLSVVENQID